MAFLDDIADLITSVTTGFTVGGTTGNLAKAVMLDTQPDTVTVLYESAGPASQFAFSTSSTAVDEVFRYPQLQVLSRAVSYTVARANAETIYQALNGRSNSTVNGTVYDKVQAVQTPFSVGRDDSDRYLVSCNYQTTVVV